MESDLSLINKLKEENDESSLVELIDRHSGIYVYIVDQFTKSKNCPINRDFILEDKNYIIYKSAIAYRPEKNSKFSTFLANQTKWRCLNEITASSKKKEVGIDSIYNMQSDEDNSYEALVKNETFDIFYDMLNEEKDNRVKKILDIRYKTSNTKLVPWRTVSEELGLSIQGCINIHNKFIQKVKKQINKNYV
jgi:hypothetical protein